MKLWVIPNGLFRESDNFVPLIPSLRHAPETLSLRLPARSFFNPLALIRLMGGQGRHGDDVVHGGPHRHHFGGFLQTQQQRTDHRAAAQFVKQLGGDIGCDRRRLSWL